MDQLQIYGARRRAGPSLTPSHLPLNPWGDRRRRVVGLLGGSFNPAHDGHRHISLAALRQLSLDEVWWLVSPQNPMKPVKGMGSLADRLAKAMMMARHPLIRVTALEADFGTRYTADTIDRIRVRFPGIRFVWLMGADNLVQIYRWRRWMGIYHSVAVAVLDRAPYSYGALSGLASRRFGRFRLGGQGGHELAHHALPAWVYLRQRRHPASATEIRRLQALDLI